MTPATSAASIVIVKDWQEATVPRISGKRSRTISVAPGAGHHVRIPLDARFQNALLARLL